MRKLCSVFLIAVMLLTYVPAPNLMAKQVEGAWVYEISDGNATILEYNGSGGNITIPKELGGSDVVKIGESAFENCKSLTGVIIPDSVTKIDKRAFRECSALTSVTIPDSVASIGENAFTSCVLLNELILPNSITEIGVAAFANCASLRSIKIPDSITKVGVAAFLYCNKLEEVIIPDSVTTIGALAFGLCPSLTSITIPASVTTVESGAFYDCASLNSITFFNPGQFVIDTNTFAYSPSITINGYPESSSEAFATANNIPFLPIKPITLCIKKDKNRYEGVDVINESGEVKKTDASGMVYFPAGDFKEKVYNYLINIGDNSYKVDINGQPGRVIELVTLKVKVMKEGRPLKDAVVSINTQTASKKKTKEDGIAEYLLWDNAASHKITVETGNTFGQVRMSTSDIKEDGTFVIDIDDQKIRRPMITGKVLHNGNGLSGIVLTAKKQVDESDTESGFEGIDDLIGKPKSDEDENRGELLYAMTKSDGSYRFILPADDDSLYTLNVVQADNYDKGVLSKTQKTDIRTNSTDNDFLFEDGVKLSGTVKNTHKNLLTDVKLYLEKDNKIWTAETDESGQYQFIAMESGAYKLYYGKSGHIYTRSEMIQLDKDTTKDIVLTGYSVTNPRNIKSDISVKSPIELGGKGQVSVRCQNLDTETYKDLMLEVNIPEGVVIDDEMLGKGQIYDATKRKVSVKVDLGGSGNPDGTDFTVFSFMYRLEDGYPKDKVVFTAFVREEAAAVESMKEYEMTSLDWSRTEENKTLLRETDNPVWQWSELSGLTTEEKEYEKVWDGQSERYFDMYADGSDITKDYATWKFQSQSGIEYRRFQSSFKKPNKEYNFSHILSENYAAYSGSGAVFPINDEVFIFVYPEGTDINNTNAKDYLAFWGSTQWNKYPDGKFMGVDGNKALWYKQTGAIPALQHSDYWVLDGTNNRIQDIFKSNSDKTNYVIDVFASDYSQGGGMDKFNLVFTDSDIPSLDTQKATMPYVDFIGISHAELFKPTLTGDDCVNVSFTKSGEYKLRGQSMKESDVKIFRLDTGTEVADFHTAGYYSEIGTALPPVPGTYPFIAECTKGSAVINSNIHVVEVLDDLKLTEPPYLTSAKIQNIKRTGKNPYITYQYSVRNVMEKQLVNVTTTFEGLKDRDKVYYKLSDENISYASDGNLSAKMWTSASSSSTKYVTVIVMRDGEMIFSQVIGCIYMIIDPSGYVYDKHTQKRIEGATVTCYVQDQKGAWDVWPAKNYGQENPLKTDAEGKYAWDVPDGVYKVMVEQEGYAPYDTLNDPRYAFEVGQESSIVIPPPRLDINMGIENISKPEIVNSFPEKDGTVSPDDMISFEFNKAMDADTMKNGISLTDGAKTIIIDAVLNRTQDVVTLVPKEPLAEGEYTVSFADTIKDYQKDKNLDAQTFTLTVSNDVTPQREAFIFEEEQLDIGIDGAFTVNFNHEIHFAVNPDGTDNTYAVLTSQEDDIPVSLSLSSDKKGLIVQPQAALKQSSEYTLTLSGIETADGLTLLADKITIKTLEMVKTPTADIESSYLEAGANVALDVDTIGATIRYTTDGSLPTESSTEYKNPIKITKNTVIKAVAFKEKMSQSDLVIFSYTVGAAANPLLEETPNAVIDYFYEELTGLDAEAKYTFDGTEYTSDADGAINILSSWFGKTLSIIKKGDNKDTFDSNAQTLEVPARPIAPTSPVGDNTKIIGVDSSMEYKKSSETVWKACSGTSVTGLEGGLYEVRKRAVVGVSFVSESKIVTVSVSPDVTPPAATPTASPNVTPPIVTPTASPNVTPPIVTPSPSPNVTPPKATPTASPNVTPPIVTPTASPNVTPPKATPTASPNVTPPRATPTASPSVTPPKATPTASPSITPPKATPSAFPNVTIPGVIIPGSFKVTAPKKPASLKVKNKKKKGLYVSWKKVAKADGYQVMIAQSKNFKKAKKIKLTKSTKRAFKGLKKKKTYYVKVRAYKVDKKTKIFGKWTKWKKVTIKKSLS